MARGSPPALLTDNVADIAAGLLLAAAREIPQADRFVREEKWAKGNMPLVTASAARLSVSSEWGAAVARRLAAFDSEIAYFDVSRQANLPYAFVADLVELARRAGFLIVTLAGGEATKGIVDAGVLEALGPDGILVNVSRRSTSTKRRSSVPWRRGRSGS